MVRLKGVKVPSSPMARLDFDPGRAPARRHVPPVDRRQTVYGGCESRPAARILEFFGRRGVVVHTPTPWAEEAVRLGQPLHRLLSR